MLIRLATLNGIKAGEITLAFRRWKRPTVKKGGTLNTRIGQLAIDDVEVISEKQITRQAAQKAGYPDRDSLLNELNKSEETLYRIRLRFLGADPRVSLRSQTKLSSDEVRELHAKLERYDNASKKGPWTLSVLQLIKSKPQTRAADLAEFAGYEKTWFKTNVRKLKNIGLTESLEVGYKLSPRGRAVLKTLEKNA